MSTNDLAPTTGDPLATPNFDKVFLEELECIKARRFLLQDPSELAEKPDGEHYLDLCKVNRKGNVDYQAVLNSDLSGITISGGGIRSATFGLGVLQGLAAAGLLRRFDYLSTVSGGGYIGSWLQALIKRQGLSKVEKDLKVPRGIEEQKHNTANPGADVEAIKHLRRYSNYLAPRVGLLSIDSWVLVAIYVRNLLLNQLVILGLMLAFYLLARSLVELFTLSHNLPDLKLPRLAIAAGIVEVSAVLGLIAFAVLGSHHKRTSSLGAIAVTLLSSSAVVTSLYLAANGVGADFWRPENGWAIHWSTLSWLAWRMALAQLLLSLAIVAGREVSRYLGNDAKFLWQAQNGRYWMVWEIFWTLCAGSLAGIAGAAILFTGLLVLFAFPQYTVATFSVFGPPVLLVSFVLTNYLHVGLLGAILRRYDRERWSSLNARFLVVVLNWLFLLGITVYSPWLIVWLTERDWGTTIGALLGSSWVATTLGGLWAGNSADTGKPAGALKKLLAAVAPYVFILGLAIALCYAANYAVYEVNAAMLAKEPLLNPPSQLVPNSTRTQTTLLSEPRPDGVRVDVEIIRGEQPSRTPVVAEPGANLRRFPYQQWDYLTNLNESQLGLQLGRDLLVLSDKLPPLFSFCAAAALVYLFAWVLAKCIGLNAFTLHDLYAHRLIRCYLGASHPRDPDPLTNFDPYDDLRLSELVPASIQNGVPLEGGGNTILAAAANKGATTVEVAVAANFAAGQVVQIGQPGAERELRKILSIGRTGMRSTKIELEVPLAFDHRLREACQAILSTTLVADSNIGDSSIEVASVAGLTAGDFIRIGPPGKFELRKLKLVERAAQGGKLFFAIALQEPHSSGDIVIKACTEGATQVFLGPYHLLNGALNRSGARQHGNPQERQAEALAFQDRKAESFVFSPLYCGSEATGYCRTNVFADNIKVGSAMAVSGAAISSNMGYQSTPAMTILLTLFNLRLGAWFGNPKNTSTRTTRNPPFSPLNYIKKEMLGKVAADAPYVYVSDGGHFENMGVYELIRRRCRFIVAIDTWADPDMRLENLGRLVRNVRVDFGIRVEIDIEPTRLSANKTSLQHFAFGRIHYGDVHRKEDFQASPLNDPQYRHEANQGILLYLKVGLTGDEPNDLKNYQAETPLFPHHPIDDQFFDEAQFESYRELGAHTVEQLLEGQAIADPISGTSKVPELKLYGKEDTIKQEVDQSTTFKIFDDLFRHWLTPPPHHHSEIYARHNDVYAQVMKELRSAKELQNLAAEFYGNQTNPNPVPTVAERLMVAEMMTLLENAWFGLELERYRHHPQNAGWMHVFRAWATKPTAQKVWEQIKLEFNPSFIAFIATVRSEAQP